MDQLTVWYDGDCPLCRREIGLMRRLDRRSAIHFVDLCAGEASCPLDRGQALARLHALDQGQIVSGAAAFAAMWRRIPVLSPLGQLARNKIALRCLEGAYLAFLRLRPRIQALVVRLEGRRRPS
jgi:predicted DCC family thiol-disulfide oxidoreductase YuxK